MPGAGILIGGRFRLLGEIGRGGMGRIFLAEDIDTGERKAVKAVRLRQGEGYAALRTESEIDMMKRLCHPGLPMIEEVIPGEDEILIVMEHIPGRSLLQLLGEFGAQPAASVLDWMIQLCEILHYMHTREPPVVYRDVKPANIMLRSDGRIMLVDLGAAREYEPGGCRDTVLLGTRGYAAPEQYGGKGQSGPRADIYGLGKTAYHLLTGHDPSKPPHMRQPPGCRDPVLPPALVRLIQKCTRHDPEKRYASCIEVLAELKAVLRDMETSESGYTELIAQGERRYRTETDLLIIHTDRVIP